MKQTTRHITIYAGLILLASLPFSAVADDRLDRFEKISERGNEVMTEVMVREYGAMGMDESALRDAMPDGAWDDEFRDAGRCMLERYTDIIGESGVDRMLDQMDAMFQSLDSETATMEDISAMSEVSALEDVSTDQQVEITNECGMVEISMRRMRDSGFTELLQQQMMQGAQDAP